jgi:hypothetical protein
MELKARWTVNRNYELTRYLAASCGILDTPRCLQPNEVAAIKREEEKIVLAVAIQAVAGELPIFAPKIAVMSGRMMAAAGAGGGGVIRT